MGLQEGSEAEQRIVVANLVFAVRAATPALHRALDSYFSKEAPAPADERVRFVEGPREARREGDELVVSAGPGEVLASLHGMLVAALDVRGGALLHGAAVVVNGKGVLCVAPSEGGKTTLCAKLAGRLPVLSDETVALWFDRPTPEITGTFFWSGESLPTLLGRFPLAAVCFLAKGEPGVASMERAEAVRALLAEWHLPERPGAADEALASAERLLATVPFLHLSTRLDTDPLPLLALAARG